MTGQPRKAQRMNQRGLLNEGTTVREGAQPTERDVSGHCERRRHRDCTGKLLAATGYHWFCACKCHPAPTEADCGITAPREAVRRALDTWSCASGSGQITEQPE